MAAHNLKVYFCYGGKNRITVINVDHKGTRDTIKLKLFNYIIIYYNSLHEIQTTTIIGDYLIYRGSQTLISHGRTHPLSFKLRLLQNDPCIARP
jgi:hypothetical protein